LARSLTINPEFQSGSRKTSIETSPIQILRRATPFFIFIAALQILDRADKFFLAYHVPLDHIATYGISLLVFFSGMTLIRIIRNVTMPWLSESGNDNNLMVERYQISSYLCFSILPFGIVMALLLMLTVPIVIFPEDLIYPGHQEFSSESIFRILLVTWSINMVLSPAWEAMRAFQPANMINKISITGLAFTLISGTVLIPFMGVYGAATMTLIAPLIFLFLAHYKMDNTLMNNLGRSYYRDLIIMTIYSFTPLIMFIPSLDSISAFILILIISMTLGIKILSVKPEKKASI
jgi:O-antigen/teichoic acid export membrane protein